MKLTAYFLDRPLGHIAIVNVNQIPEAQLPQRKSAAAISNYNVQYVIHHILSTLFYSYALRIIYTDNVNK